MNKKRWLIITVIVAAAVLVSILSYTMLVNHPPIARMAFEAARVFPSESTQIWCIASDRDGDELTFDWSAIAGDIHGEGATIIWTAPAFEGLYNVAVTVTDDRGGEVTQHVTIRVKANEPPEIDSMTADARWTLPSGSLHVACNASDPDGHELSYEWSASRGGITGTGVAVNWTAPEELGMYDITVVVSDGHGGTAMRTLPISVVTGQPPVIEDLFATAEHRYLREISGGYEVLKNRSYEIECIVSDTSIGLFYEWSCNDVAIPGERSLITWTAPNTSRDVTVTVTVTVSDVAGNMVSETIVFDVRTCAPCSF